MSYGRSSVLSIVCILTSIVFAFSSTRRSPAAEPLLKPNDCLALVGGTLVERPAFATQLEFELQTRQPQWKLKLRNLGWAGDDVHGFARKVFETNPAKGRERLIQDLKIAQPTAVLLCYGFAEASDPLQTPERFRAGLEQLIHQVEQLGARPLLLQPFALPGVKLADYPQRMANCAQIVAELSEQQSIPLLKVSCSDWTDDGLGPSVAGYQAIGQQLAAQLTAQPVVSQPVAKGEYAGLLDCIQEKNELFFHRHRPQNETYLLLFRKHEQGNNAVELPQFDPLIQSLDERIWNLATQR